jgi:hypothetical protein
MDVLDKSSDDLVEAMLPELAKAMSEIKCARQDLEKATNRMGFLLLLVNTVIKRPKDQQI